MNRLCMILSLFALLALSAERAGAGGADSLQPASARLTTAFRSTLPAYQADLASILRSGRTTDKVAMDSLTAEARALARLLGERDSLLFRLPGDGWLLVAALEDDLLLADAVHPDPSPLVTLAVDQYRAQFRLASLAPSDTAAMERQALTRVRSAIDSWKQRIDEKLWPSLQVALRDGGVTVRPFNDGESFSASMTSFFESRVSAGSGSKAQDEFQRFKPVWMNHFRADWLPALVAGGRITREDDRAMDRLFDRWDSAMAPWIWSETLVAAIGVLLLFAAAAAIYYWRTKRTV